MLFDETGDHTRFGRYRIVSKIGLGGMAEVYRAETSSRPIAIKKILSSFTDSEKFIKMFLDEAKIMITLRHPNIVELYDFGKIDEIYYLAMEWVDGKPLGNLVRRQIRRKMMFPAGIATFISMEIASGLDYAHKKKDSYNRILGLVHRDISPPNILISWGGDVKITDFGIAKAAGKVVLTKPGILKGKFSYMSPEQAKGQKIDSRSDLFSLGIVLYEMITGIRLFLRDAEHETIEAVKKTKVPPPRVYNPKVPESLERVVMKALERNPKKRFQSGEEFGDALEEVLVKDYPDTNKMMLSSYMHFLYPERDILLKGKEKSELTDFWSREARGDAKLIDSVASRIKRFERGFWTSGRIAFSATLIGALATVLLLYGFFPRFFASFISELVKIIK